MTRKECEAKLLALAEQMREVYTAYNTAGDFLSVLVDGGYIDVQDTFFTPDRNIVEDVNGNIFSTVHITRYSDGHVRHRGR